MIISADLTSSYPKLAAWLKENLPKVKNKGKVFRAFRKFSEQNSADAKTSLTLNTLPNISFRVMANANGQFSGSSSPNTVFLAKAICDKFEASAADAKDARMHLLIESTVLHEMVHWGDWKDGVDQPGEEGKAFERAAYGKDIGRYW